MQFYARLKRSSYIYREWKEKKLLAGFIDGVFFKLAGFDFVTDKLTTEEIDKFRVRQDDSVVFEMTELETKIEPKRIRLKQV